MDIISSAAALNPSSFLSDPPHPIPHRTGKREPMSSPIDFFAAAGCLLRAVSCYLYDPTFATVDPSPTPTTLLSPVAQRWARKLGFRLHRDEMQAFAAELSLCACSTRSLASPSVHGLLRAKDEAAFFHGGSFADNFHGRADTSVLHHFGSGSPPPRALQGVEELGTRLILARGFFAPAPLHALRGAEELSARFSLARSFFAPAPTHAVVEVSVSLALGRGFATSDLFFVKESCLHLIPYQV